MLATFEWRAVAHLLGEVQPIKAGKAPRPHTVHARLKSKRAGGTGATNLPTPVGAVRDPKKWTKWFHYVTGILNSTANKRLVAELAGVLAGGR